MRLSSESNKINASCLHEKVKNLTSLCFGTIVIMYNLNKARKKNICLMLNQMMAGPSHIIVKFGEGPYSYVIYVK